jgi:hypothetical protein
MNHRLWASVGARVVALTFVAAGLAACGERLSDTSSKTPKPTAASPSAVVIGQAPAEPQADTAQTTSPAGAQSTVSKAEESNDRPKEGDNHSYSTVAPVTPQKAEGVDPQQQPERKSP